MKARTLLLMCGLSLAGAAAADPIGAPRHGPDGWLFGPPEEGYDLRRRMPDMAQETAIVPLPRPRPYVLETIGAVELNALNPVTPARPTAPMPQPTPLAAPGPQNASAPQAQSAPLSATEQGAADDLHRQTDTTETPKSAAVEPIDDNGGAAMLPVSIRDAGGGRVRIEAHDASVGQVLAALQDSHLIQLSGADPPSGTVTGTYTGTLPQVLSRILDGHNYFLRVTASETELHAVNVSSDTNPALRSGSYDANAALGSGVSNVEAAAPPSPAFALSAPSPASKARARARAQQSANTH